MPLLDPFPTRFAYSENESECFAGNGQNLVDLPPSFRHTQVISSTPNSEDARDEQYALPDAPETEEEEQPQATSNNGDSERLLSEVQNWKLDAKLEDPARYFFEVTQAEQALSGERCYVIGRKGAGKTAISEHIFKFRSAGSFSEKLTFKNFLFNELYQHSNSQFKAPNEYITLWKYLIYSCICRMMAKNEGISSVIRARLAEIYAPDPIESLTRTVKKWTSKQFKLSIFGVEGAIELSQPQSDSVSIAERCDLLEDVILKYVDSSFYYVVFDELDEDFKDILKARQNTEYIDLITSLFKAVQDIRSVFNSEQYNVFPIVFLRDDIYEFIYDSDKNKWSDFRIDLDWTTPKIKRLLAFRLSRALEPNGPILEFETAWSKFFSSNTIRFGHEGSQRTSLFDYITRSTHLRPRDYVKYLQACADQARTSGFSTVGAGTVRRVDKAFSNYLRNEIIDEVQALIPDIAQVLDTFSEVRRQVLPQKLFRDAYSRRAKQESWAVQDPDFVLRILFHFSVIGNHTRQHHKVFFYQNREARLNADEHIVVHRGLFKALQLM